MLVETALATFEREEILYQLRKHSAGLDAGRWDYIVSCIKKLNFCLAQRDAITMEAPFMCPYADMKRWRNPENGIPVRHPKGIPFGHHSQKNPGNATSGLHRTKSGGNREIRRRFFFPSLGSMTHRPKRSSPLTALYIQLQHSVVCFV